MQTLMFPFPQISIGLIHFPTCNAEHLRLSLASVIGQVFNDPLRGWPGIKEILIYDNSSGTRPSDIDGVVREAKEACPEIQSKLRYVFDRHLDPAKTHPYSLNSTLDQLAGPALFITRSDYILHPQILTKLAAAAQHALAEGKQPFVSAWCHQAAYDRNEQPYPAFEVGQATWDQLLATAPGHVFTETDQDAGVWLSMKGVLGGCRLNEHLSAWGYAQSTWQRELKTRGAAMIAVPETLFFHQQHGDWARDHALARAQYEQFGGGR